MRIYFSGMPATMLFHFGSALLRASGDSRRPMLYSILAGTVNVLLNLLFVVVFKLSVAGVAIATVASQTASALFTLRCLLKSTYTFHLKWRKLHISQDILINLIRIGLPTGLQSLLIAISNVIVQISVNRCGDTAMAAASAANSLEGCIYIVFYAFSSMSVIFTSQNYGIGNYKRICEGFRRILISSAVFGFVYSQAVVLLSPTLLRLYSNSDIVISYGVRRLHITGFTYTLCCISEVAKGALHGLGRVKGMLLGTLICDCSVRVIMTLIGTPFDRIEHLDFLYASYPVAWLLMGFWFTAELLYRFKKISSYQEEQNHG